MSLPNLLVLGALALTGAAAPSAAASRPGGPQGPAHEVRVQLDSAYRQVIVTVGPFRVERTMAMSEDMMMLMHGQDSVVGVFAWPVTAWFRAIRLEIVDAQGNALPRSIMHHMNVMNFDRRQLVYPIVERLVGFGHETSDMSVPASIGMPVQRGHRIGIVVMWHNDTDQDVEGAYLRLTFRLNPRRQTPRPMTVLPFFVDAHLVPGGVNTFDVPPGGHTQAYEFTLPISGHLLAVGGHIHEHGAWIRLEEAGTGRDIVTIHAQRDAQGQVLSVSRALLGVWGEGPHLRAGRRYRLLVRYDNPTNDTLQGMMGLMAGIFAPDDLRRWPALDRTDPAYLADLANLPGSDMGSERVVEGSRAGQPARD
jgi:hypothetical protein